MIKILFVDDQKNILDGLRRMLHTMNGEWKMSFAESGADALAMLENEEVDVLVTDMKMPAMDGFQLLNEVSERYPQTIRIILSGYSEKEINMKSVGIAHQYLSKPCETQVIKSTISRVCSLRNLLVGESLRRLVSQLHFVPSMPALYGQLVDELNGPDPSTRRIGDIVRKDIGMTGKLLQIVNSAFFGLRRDVSDPKEAVEFIGVDTIKALTLGLGVISQFEKFDSGCSFAEIWSHSLAVGTLANRIASMEKRETAGDAFTAGLLHDIGNLVLTVNLPEKFNLVESMVRNDRVLRSDAEREVFQATHPEVGAYLLGLWGLPARVVQAVAFHHTPRDAKQDNFTPLTAIYAADMIHQVNDPWVSDLDSQKIDEEYFEEVGLKDRLPIWIEQFSELEVAA